MANPIKLEINGVDLSQYLKRLDTSPAGPGQVATGTLYLTKEAGGLGILNKQVVKVWQTFDSGGNGVAARSRYFGGFVDVREEGNVGTTKYWALPCVSFQVALHAVVRDANASAAFTVTAGTFAAQVLQIVTALQKRGAASVELEIDAVSQVANLASGLPSWIAPPGKNLDFYLKEACRQAKIINTALRPAYFIDTGRTFGVGDTFGGPVLHVYDGALTPSPIYTFSDTPAGAEKSIYGELTRTLESQAMVQRKQAVYGDGFVATYTNTSSGATYRNPLINHGIGPTTNAGYWIVEAVSDTVSTSNAQAEAALALQVQPIEFPRERVVLPHVLDIVLPGEVVTVEHSLHIPTPTNYRVVEANFNFEDPTEVTQSLTLGTRRRELLDAQEEASGAQPVEGDPIGPDPPGIPVEASDVYDQHTEQSTATFTFTASSSGDTVDYEYMVDYFGTEWGPFSTGGALTYTWTGEPGYPYSTWVRGVDSSGNRGDYSDPLTGALALPDVTREVLNPSFEEFSGATIYNWVKSESGGGVVSVVTGGVSGVNCLSCDATAVGASATATSEQFIEVQALRIFVFSVYAKATTAMSSALTLKVHWYSAARILLSTSTVQSAVSVTTTWVIYRGVATAPTSAAYCKIEVGDNTGTSAAALLVDTVKMNVQSAPEDLASNSVTGAKLAANSVSGSKIVNAAILTDHLSDESVTSAKFVEIIDPAKVRLAIESAPQEWADVLGRKRLSFQYDPTADAVEISTDNVTSDTDLRFKAGGGTMEFDTTAPFKFTGGGSIVTQAAALGTSDTAGFLYIPTCAGAPTGTPAAQTGTVPLVFDTTNNAMYVYDGGWIKVALA